MPASQPKDKRKIINVMFINVCHERIRLGGSSVRTHERTSLRLGCGVGARPAQGAATTTDVGLVRTATTADVCSMLTLE